MTELDPWTQAEIDETDALPDAIFARGDRLPRLNYGAPDPEMAALTAELQVALEWPSWWQRLMNWLIP